MKEITRMLVKVASVATALIGASISLSVPPVSAIGLCPLGESEFTFTVKLDASPAETSWRLFDYFYNTIDMGAFDLSPPASTAVKTICFTPKTPDCYFLEMDDSARDGICCDYGKGSYSYTYKSAVTNAKALTVKRAGTYKAVDMTNFGVCGQYPLPLDRLPATTVAVTSASGLSLSYRFFYNSLIVQFPFEVGFLQNIKTGVTDIDYNFGKSYYIDKLYIQTFEKSKFDILRVSVSTIKKNQEPTWLYTNYQLDGNSEYELEIDIKQISKTMRIEVINGENAAETEPFTTFGFWYVIVEGYETSKFAPTKAPRAGSPTKAPRTASPTKPRKAVSTKKPV